MTIQKGKKAAGTKIWSYTSNLEEKKILVTEQQVEISALQSENHW